MDLTQFRTLARNWEVFGRRDPLFGVLSDPAKQHGRWETEEFFGSGRAHMAKLFRMLDDLGAATVRPVQAGSATLTSAEKTKVEFLAPRGPDPRVQCAAEP